MAFAASRPDRDLLERVSFGEAWQGLEDPTDKSTSDAFRFQDRMALYRLLVERVCLPGVLGKGDALSPFWGYASQLAWQQRSGRLARCGKDRVPSDVVDPESWWGACNYSLSVIPYVAAMQIGVVPALRFEPARVVDRDVTRFEAPLRRWRNAIRRLHALRRGDDTEGARLEIWGAHLASIRLATQINTARLLREPALEQQFARGWIRLVDLFSAAAMRTDLAFLAERGVGALPARVLSDTDELGLLGDFQKAERGAIRRVVGLGRRPVWRWVADRGLWQRIMRSRAAREDVDAILTGMFGRGAPAWRGRALSVAYATLPTMLANRVPMVRDVFERP